MWAEKRVFYHIYPLGFCGDRGLEKISGIIGHLKYIGADALYLGPVFQSANHGYDTSDYFRIDPRLGSNDDFREVCRQLHENGIKVIVDGVFNHVGREFWAFRDVRENKENSRYCDWFLLNWNGNNHYDDGFYYQNWEGCSDLVKLNLKNQDVKNHLFEAIKSWTDNYDIDGLRLDVAYCLDKKFLTELRNFCRVLKDDFWLMGEIVHGDYNQLMNERMLDSVTNYECYKGLYSSCNDKNMFEIAHSLRRQQELYGGKFMYNFLDNHDVSRIASKLKDKRDLKLLYTMLYLIPGIPSIYYGSEFGIEGDKDAGGDSILRPSLNEFTPNELTEHIRRLSLIRKENEVVVYGAYKELLLQNEQFVFSRENGSNKAVCAVNLSEEEYEANIEGQKINIPPKEALLLIDGKSVLQR